MVDKVVGLERALSLIKDGDVLMIGGFLANGTPERLIDGLVERGIQDLTLICNDTGFIDRGVGKLVASKQFKTIYASHIGTNKETGRQMNEGETIVNLVPQGTLVEQIRAGGYGLGGILTRTGIGTMVQQGKEKVEVDGVEYLLEKPLNADVALLYGTKVDRFGNTIYQGSTNNFNNVMAAAAKVTIVEAEEIVEVGELDPNTVHTSGIFVNYVVDGRE